MLVSFFEEFPSDNNLSKLKQIRFKTKLYLAAPSISEFNVLNNKVKRFRNVEKVVYWPVLRKEEGYWISPFSSREGILRIFRELKNEKNEIMIDAELPYEKNNLSILFDVLNLNKKFFNKRKIIREFVKKNNVYSAEYPSYENFKDILLEFFGLSYNPLRYKNRIIKMVYGFSEKKNNELIKVCKYWVKRCKGRFIVGLGVIAKGIGDEKILLPKELDKQLDIINRLGVSEAVIYRLGGLDKDYLNVINKYV